MRAPVESDRVRPEQLAPAAFPELGSFRRRSDNVREEDRCEHPVRLLVNAFAYLLEEALELGEQGLTIENERNQVASRQDDQTGGRNTVGHVVACAPDGVSDFRPDEHERGHTHGRQDVSKVDVRVEPEVLGHVARAHAEADRAL